MIVPARMLGMMSSFSRVDIHPADRVFHQIRGVNRTVALMRLTDGVVAHVEGLFTA